jgi:predicted HicB family RNase H-like nuclease
MKITLELPPEAEATLAAQAKARGLSLDAFVRTSSQLKPLPWSR